MALHQDNLRGLEGHVRVLIAHLHVGEGIVGEGIVGGVDGRARGNGVFESGRFGARVAVGVRRRPWARGGGARALSRALGRGGIGVGGGGDVDLRLERDEIAIVVDRSGRGARGRSGGHPRSGLAGDGSGDMSS